MPKLIDLVASLFKSPHEEVRIAASICLGNLAIGNADFFLAKVFSLADQADAQERYLFMNTIREIITHNPKCLEPYNLKLVPLLISHTKHEDEQIRNIVSESLGKLYAVYPTSINVDSSFSSSNPLERSTVVKSFKYAASKECDSQDIAIMVSSIIDLVRDQDLHVKKNSLEALIAIVHNHAQAIKADAQAL